MTHYIAMVHKEQDSCFGVSFPDLVGHITAAETLDRAVERARALLAFVASGWETEDGPFPAPRSIDELRRDPEFLEDSAGAILIAVPLETSAFRPAAE